MQKLSTTKITEGLTNENEISRLVGIMDTNSHEIFNRNGYICKGIYPLVSFLSHGCIINARPCIKKEAPFTSVLQATVKIPKGKGVSVVEMLMYNFQHIANVTNFCHNDELSSTMS